MSSDVPKKVEVIVPCFNEELALRETFTRLQQLLDDLDRRRIIAPSSVIRFVDDGSTDGTWKLIEFMAAQHARCEGIKLSRNRGHQIALLAGLQSVTGDVAITIDADLQDDISAIESMIAAHDAGAEVVYGVRNSREADSLFKRVSAERYYKLLKAMGVDIVFNHADYRLLGRRALDALREYGEVNVFLRGIVPQLGFKSETIYYDRASRIAGTSKYSLRKMVSLGLEGVTSFSAMPLRWIAMAGFIISLLSFGMGAWALIASFIPGATVPGWASMVIPMYFLGGVQLLSMGIVGEYVARIYTEVKRRPRFFIEKSVQGQKPDSSA